MTLFPLLLLFSQSSTVNSAAKRRTPLLETNPNELDFLNAAVLSTHLGIRFKYRGRTLVLQYSPELHFTGSKKYYVATFEDDPKIGGKNLTSCIYDVTNHHEFPQLLDEPDERSLLVFRCPFNGCNPNDVGCKTDWKLVKIALTVMLVLIVFVSILCYRYQKTKKGGSNAEINESSL